MQDQGQVGGLATSRLYVSLLRGINVGGRHKLLMRELAEMFVEAGCEDVRTYIQSGNVVFRAAPSLPDCLSARITTAIAASHGYQIPVVIRTAADLARVVRGNPLLADGADPTKLHVGFLAEAPDPAKVARLDPDRSPPDAFVVRGDEVYLHFPNGVARSKLTNNYLDRTLGTVSTIRNWRTVCRLNEMASGA